METKLQEIHEEAAREKLKDLAKGYSVRIVKLKDLAKGYSVRMRDGLKDLAKGCNIR
jgi:hypothetical protein